MGFAFDATMADLKKGTAARSQVASDPSGTARSKRPQSDPSLGTAVAGRAPSRRQDATILAA